MARRVGGRGVGGLVLDGGWGRWWVGGFVVLEWTRRINLKENRLFHTSTIYLFWKANGKSNCNASVNVLKRETYIPKLRMYFGTGFNWIM